MPNSEFQGRNHILSRLATADYRLLASHLEHVRLAARRKLETAGKRIDHVFFMEYGFASLIARGPQGRDMEIALVGNEGMTGMPVVMGTDRSPNEMVMQVTGAAHCMRADNLRRRLRESRTLHMALLCYAQALLVQIGQAALAGGRSTIDARVARWLLMAHDRVDSELTLTHETLAGLLGVRRPGVTIALKALEAAGLVRTDRRTVRILDRDGLRRAANGSYGVSEDEYARLFG